MITMYLEDAMKKAFATQKPPWYGPDDGVLMSLDNQRARAAERGRLIARRLIQKIQAHLAPESKKLGAKR